jgi:predicted secreted protein
MLRSKEIILISHCVLNQNSVVYPLARAKGALGFARFLMDRGIGIVQLPCPEMRHLGITRKPMEKEEYDTVEYRKLCLDLSRPIADDISTYLHNGYTIHGIIGINESPTCSITGKRGIFMEELIRLLKDKDICLRYFEVPADYDDEKDCGPLWSRLKDELNIR